MKPTEPQRLYKDFPALTGVRGLAALAVVWHHADIWSGNQDALGGQLWVDLFFILSGFVLSFTYYRDDGTFKIFAFATARLARIYPLFIASSLAVAGLAIAQQFATSKALPDWVSADNAIRELLLVTALPYVGSEHIWNDPSWSISVEWWNYFTVFVALMIFGRNIGIKILTFATVLSAIFLVAALYNSSGEQAIFTERVNRGWFALLRAIVGCSFGYCMFRFYRDIPMLRLSPRYTDTFLVASFAAIYLAPAITGMDAWFMLLVLPFDVYLLAIGKGRVAGILSSPLVMYFGVISYSIYLLHTLALSVTLHFVGGFPIANNFLVWVAMTIAVTLVFSAVSYRFFERPARDWIKSVAMSWRAPKRLIADSKSTP